MNCHQCGVCCTAISISTPIPGMPKGKPAGIPCIHLSGGLCKLFGKSERPSICSSFQATPDFCGSNATEALQLISQIERLTTPGG